MRYLGHISTSMDIINVATISFLGGWDSWLISGRGILEKLQKCRGHAGQKWKHEIMRGNIGGGSTIIKRYSLNLSTMVRT